MDSSDLKQKSAKLLTLSSQLETICNDIQSMGNLSGFTSEDKYTIQKRINEFGSSIQKQYAGMKNMGNRLTEIEVLYENAENETVGQAGETSEDFKIQDRPYFSGGGGDMGGRFAATLKAALEKKNSMEQQ